MTLFVLVAALVTSLGILAAALAAACYVPKTQNPARLDAFQCGSWRSEGYTESEIKQLCEEHNITYHSGY